MSRIKDKIRSMLRLLRQRHFRAFFAQLRLWLYSESYSFGLRRDLTVPFVAPQAKIPIRVRPMEQEDVQKVLDVVSETAGQDQSWIFSELRMLDAGIPTGYIATTEDDTPCFVQWLLSPKENEWIEDYFRGTFPLLAADEALLEGGYTVRPFRRQGIMTSGVAQVAECAMEFGARWVITFVDHGNIASLKGIHRAGFEPYIIRREKYRFFRKIVSYEPLSDSTPYPLGKRSRSVAGGLPV